MDKLVEAMKRVLADSFSFYLKAHYFHWNVEGSDFAQYHGFFGDIYEEVYGAIDPIAEHIRALGAYSPGSLRRFAELTVIEDESTVPAAGEMAARLRDDNVKVIATLKEAQLLAEQVREVGVANYLQDRIDTHQKHAWMLRAITK